jgi:phage tail-like protein
VVAEGGSGNGAAGSSYLQYLPAIYQDDELMGQFLLIFESIMNPLANSVGNLELYFDPRTAPESLLPWLASWLGLALDESWPLERRRELVRSAADLHRWRGTRRGLSEYIEIYAGAVPEISEYIEGMRLDEGTRLGSDTRLGSSGTGHHFTVTLNVDDDSSVDAEKIRAIVESQKPAHTAYTLRLVRGGARKGSEVGA